MMKFVRRPGGDPSVCADVDRGDELAGAVD
jgi:hypothetical protein